MAPKLKITLIVSASIVCTSLVVTAGDTLLGLRGGTDGVLCPEGTDLVLLGGTSLCVDRFEAGPSASCPKQDIRSELDTLANLETSACERVSREGRLPWRYVALAEAQQICARSGGRVPTNAEWHRLASSVREPESCTIQSSTVTPTGENTDCISESGQYDLIGNVWEWVDETVVDGVIDDIVLPGSGYVVAVDNNGISVETSAEPDALYGADYAWTKSDGVGGLLRGGFYNSGSDAGIFTLNAAVPMSFRTNGVGFRCVFDV